MKKEISDISAGIVLLMLSVLGYVAAGNLVDPQSPVKYGPDFFPKLVLSLLAITSFILLVNGIRKIKTSKEYMDINKRKILVILAFIIILIGYIGLFFVTGFIISTIVFLLIGQWIFGVKKVVFLILTSISVPALLYFLFSTFFKIPLP